MTHVDWHPYPKEKPKDDGYYIVTINPFLNSYPVVSDFWKSMTVCDEDFSKTETVSFWERYGGQVLAWAELPEPYCPKEPYDNHPDAVTARKYMSGDTETVKALHIFDE